MKSKLIMVGLIVVVALSLLACSPEAAEEPGAPNKVHIEVVCDDYIKQQHITEEVEIAAGGVLTLILCSNPTTGFNWQPAVISDETVLKQEGESEFVPPDKAIPGAGGKEVWTFKAFKKGTSSISMEYSRPWEGGEKGEWTFNLTVVVK